jgi:hypothetical protein
VLVGVRTEKLFITKSPKTRVNPLSKPACEPHDLAILAGKAMMRVGLAWVALATPAVDPGDPRASG